MKNAMLLLFLLLPAIILKSQGFEHFVQARDGKLIEGDEAYRFISFNIPNLNYVEDEFDFKAKHPYRLPDAFEIRDAFESVKQMGGKVIRIYTIPVKRRSNPEDVPTFVTGPGDFVEESFRANDLMLSIANETGIRIIFSLLNNWKWMGGAPQYAEFRGKTFKDFWTDKQLIKDFKKTIKFTLNRKNTITGVKYKHDKSILCWETGNELQAPPEWTAEIAAYIKKLDKNHLVMDGFYAVDHIPVREASIEDPNIDIISSHHYEKNPKTQIDNIKKNIEKVAGRKPYILGEFGFISTTAMEKTLDLAIENGISGALIWSLRYHRREGGFYWHSEPLGLGLYKAYHWPGFNSGKAYDEKNVMRLMREKAFEIDDMQAPEVPEPDPPLLLPIQHASEISWQGSVGASSYDVERSSNKNGPWETIGHNVSDAKLAYVPLFEDQDVMIGNSYYYRILAKNTSGQSEPSNVVGPVEVLDNRVIDNAENYGVPYHTHKISLSMGDDRKFKERLSRYAGMEGSEIIYFTKGSVLDIEIHAFEKGIAENLIILTSSDGNDFTEIQVQREGDQVAAGDYGYTSPAIYKAQNSEANVHFVKIAFKSEVHISRVEISYK